MKFDSRKRKRWADESGVSEIIGNILILMITVVLFSTIIGFVQQMPVPTQQTKADFSASIIFSSDGTNATIALEHAGGDRLLAKDILVIIKVDSVNYAYYLVNDTDWDGTYWNTGARWTKYLSPTQYSSIIEASVVDMMKHETIWTSQVAGGSGNNPPMILERYVDSHPETPTPDPVLENDSFTLFVRISDPDNDLNRDQIWIDSSQIEGAAAQVRYKEAEPSPGIFTWYFNVHVNAFTHGYIGSALLDGAVIMIHARDMANHQSNSPFIMEVTVLPVRDIITPGGEEPAGEGGLPGWLTNPGGRQGFGIYGENKSGGVPHGVANVKDNRTVFTKDEMVFIRFASLDMNNIEGQNVVTLMDMRTKVYYIPAYVLSSWTGSPFYRYTSGGNVFIYECKFNTSGLPPGLYSIGMLLKNNPSLSGGQTFSFNASSPISIRQSGSPITFEPSVWLFKDSGRTQIWGAKSRPYEVSGGTYKIFGSVRVMDAQASPAPTVEDIRIQDLSGAAQIFGRPVAGYMLPAWTASGNMTAYNFEIDLRYANGNQWMGGTNSYTLIITKMADANEGLYSLTAQVFVKAFSAHADFFVGTTGIAVGHANFDAKEYVLFIENNNFFTVNSMWGYINTPSDKNTFATTAMAAGDLSGDGFKDILAAQDNSKSLLYFKNSLDTYGRWQDGSVLPRPASDIANNIKWIAFGDINGDGALDFAYVSTANKIVIYNNTYGMTPRVFLDLGTTVVRKIDLKDMNGDGKADLIVLAGGKILIHNLALWGISTTLMVRMPDSASGWSGGSGILDFDIADMNGDGKLDILTAGDAGTIAGMPDFRGVWINNYTTNAIPTTRFLDRDATYYNIRIAAGTKVSGVDVQDTWSIGGAALQFAENMTDLPKGQVKVTMKFQTLDTTDLVQTLVVRARLVAGSEESFYAWFSQDTDGNSDKFVPIFQIVSTVYQNYTFQLPSSVAGKPIYLRFTDGTSATGSYPDSILIDYVVVLSHQFGSYISQRTNVVVGAGSGWSCVRAAEIDGPSDMYPDVVAAKNGAWAAFQPRYNVGGSPIVGWSASDPNMYVYSTDTLMANTAPTLFDATDINGDGYDDILVTNYTAAQSAITQVGFYMNMYPVKVWYRVCELGRSEGSGAITVTLASNLSVG